VLPQPAQQPLASSPGEAGESSQVQVQEAPAAIPSLDDKLSAALAKAQDTRDRLARRQKSLAELQRQSLTEVGQREANKEKLYNVFEQEKRFAEDDRRQLGRELQELQALQAVQAGTAQHGEQDDTDL